MKKEKLDILYEDKSLIIVNKKSGILTIANDKEKEKTLYHEVHEYLWRKNKNNKVFIIHRLDKDTSGLLLVAKNDDVHVLLSEELKLRKVNRKYLALVYGVINNDTGTIDAPIGRSLFDRKKMAVTSENSKDAITHIRVLDRYKDSTLIRCKLETGRTHQIRVHLNYIGHPVVNDPVYGYKKLIDKDFGQMLHAEKIGFVHPTTKEYMEFTAPLPYRFKEILEIYKAK